MTAFTRIFARLARHLRSREPIVLLLFFIAAGAAFLFLTLADEIIEGDTLRFDEAILRALRQPADLASPVGPGWLTKALTDFTSLGGVTVLSLLTVLAVSYLLIIGKRRTGLFLLMCIGGGWLMSHAMKLGIARPRPEIVAHLVDVNDFSFPSGHAMLSAVTYLTLGALLSRTQTNRAARYFFVVAAILLTLVVGVSRVYLGVHYPTDVLGGWTAGAAWACLCWLIARWLLPREPETDTAPKSER